MLRGGLFLRFLALAWKIKFFVENIMLVLVIFVRSMLCSVHEENFRLLSEKYNCWNDASM